MKFEQNVGLKVFTDIYKAQLSVKLIIVENLRQFVEFLKFVER